LVLAIMFCTSADLVTSTRTELASPPLALIEAAISSARAPSISPITTLAPRRAKATAVARPMPAAPPVTTTTFPVMRSSDISEFRFDGADAALVSTNTSGSILRKFDAYSSRLSVCPAGHQLSVNC
jgi:hypothetical protein